jgi:hypothetical protein
MIDTWIFSEQEEEDNDPDEKRPLRIREESWNRAVSMAKAIIQEQMASGVKDVNENATQFIVDWILSNRQYFGEKAIGTCLGTVSPDQRKVYIYPSILNQTLSKAGYSPRKTLKYLADNNIITSKKKTNGVAVYSVTKWFDNRSSRFVEFDLGRFSKPTDPLDEDEAAMQRDEEPKTVNDGWQQLDMNDVPPFEEPPDLPY